MTPIVLAFQLATSEPYSTLAREAVAAWNINACVLLSEAPTAPLVVGAYRLGLTPWAGAVLQTYPDSGVRLLTINESTLEWSGDNPFWRLSALCHEFGHALGINEHSVDPASCMSVTWTSVRPSAEDLAWLAARCQ